jgi:hypothetical protein
VDVDKTEVCKGEQITVSVRARSLDSAPELLNYGVVAHPDIGGPRFTLKLEESLGVDWMKVFVRGQHGTIEVASIPPVLVKACEAPFVASIGVRRRAAAFDRVWLRGSVAARDSPATTWWSRTSSPPAKRTLACFPSALPRFYRSPAAVTRRGPPQMVVSWLVFVMSPTSRTISRYSRSSLMA